MVFEGCFTRWSDVRSQVYISQKFWSNYQCSELSQFTVVRQISKPLRCHNCGEETPDFIYCTLTDSSPLTGGRGSASVVLKCKLCKRENSIDILKETLSSYTAADAGKFKSVVTFDCRGVEPIDFSPRVGWSVEGEETSTVFSDINLGEKEWYDYDEKGQTSVSITEFQHKFVTSR